MRQGDLGNCESALDLLLVHIHKDTFSEQNAAMYLEPLQVSIEFALE